MATLDLVSAGETNWATQQNANLTALNTELIATTAKANAAQVAADLDDDTAALAADSESALRTELNAAYAAQLVGTGLDATAIQAWLESPSALGVKRLIGDITLDEALAPPSGTRLDCTGSTVGMGSLPYAVTLDGTAGVTIVGGDWSADTAAGCVVYAEGGATSIALHNLTCIEARLIRTNAGVAYADADSEIIDGIKIDGCAGAASTVEGNIAFIELRYIQNATITGNTIKGYRSGIQWWGGDSDPSHDGALANERKARNLTITGNIVEDVEAGGIWGSMGHHVAIAGNTVRDCGDVGIDVEGCFDVAITGNTTAECVNGGIVVYFYCDGVTVTGNAMSTTTADEWLFRIKNSGTYSDSRNVVITGNVMRGDGVIARAGGEGTRVLTIRGNTFSNVRLDGRTPTNLNGFLIESNEFTFDIAAGAAVSAISVGKVRGPAHWVSPVIIRNNTITSSVAQPSGSIAIDVLDDHANQNHNFTIENNRVYGWQTDVKFVNSSNNAGHQSRLAIVNNQFGQAHSATSLDISTTGAGTTTLTFEGNRDHQNRPYLRAVPTSGAWSVGNRATSEDPASTGFIGWVCTAAGSPGTWKTYAPVSA